MYWWACRRIGVYLSSLVASRMPSSTMNTSLWGLSIMQEQLDFSLFNELCRCFQQWGLAVILWRDNLYLDNSFDYLGIPVGPFWSTTQLDVTQIWYWKHVWPQEMTNWSLSPPLFGIFIQITLYMYFRRFLLYWVSILPFKCPWILAVSLSFLPITPLLHMTSHSLLYPPTYKYLFCFLFLMKSFTSSPLLYTYPLHFYGL